MEKHVDLCIKQEESEDLIKEQQATIEMLTAAMNQKNYTSDIKRRTFEGRRQDGLSPVMQDLQV